MQIQCVFKKLLTYKDKLTTIKIKKQNNTLSCLLNILRVLTSMYAIVFNHQQEQSKAGLG